MSGNLSACAERLCARTTETQWAPLSGRETNASGRYAQSIRLLACNMCVCVCPLAKRGNEVQRVREEGYRWTMRVFAEAEVGWLVAAGERKDERRDRGKGDCPVKGFIGIGRLDREMW